jgi:four helix bundle protein
MATKFCYRDLRIWQEAVDLPLVIYRATADFPKHELYGLTSQMRRAAVSVSSNIAEGKGHSSDGDFGRFLFHARGWLLELQTQIVIAGGLAYVTNEQAANLTRITDDLGRGLNGLIKSVRGRRNSSEFSARIANSERRTAASLSCLNAWTKSKFDTKS